MNWANEWVSSLGIREQQDRLRQHIARIEGLEQARQAGVLNESTQSENGRLAMFSFTEAMKFLSIYEAFRDEPPAELRRCLRDALQGPCV